MRKNKSTGIERTSLTPDNSYSVDKLAEKKWVVRRVDTLAVEAGPYATKGAAEAAQTKLVRAAKAEARKAAAAAAKIAAALEPEPVPEPEPTPEVELPVVLTVEQIAHLTPEQHAALTVEQIAHLDNGSKMTLARREHKARDAWKRAGAAGPAPAQPVLDYMNSGGKAAPKARARSERKRVERTPEQDAALRKLCIDGRAAGQSYKELAAAIDAAGIPSPTGKAWTDGMAW